MEGLTEAAVSLLELIFPRHVIEHMTQGGLQVGKMDRMWLWCNFCTLSDWLWQQATSLMHTASASCPLNVCCRG